MMLGDDVLMMPASPRIEVYTGSGRRRRWSAEQKAQVVAESFATSVRDVADRYGVSRTQVFTWRRDAKRAGGGGAFTRVVVEDIQHEPARGLIEVQIGTAQVRIPPGSDHQMVKTVLTALKR